MMSWLGILYGPQQADREIIPPQTGQVRIAG
jgi:hypothetical protein